MDKILSSIKCVNCQNVLSSPVLLPCGHSICHEHPNDAFCTLTGSIMCHQCSTEHGIPENGFPPSIALATIIESKIASFDFGKVHADALESCENLELLLNNIEQTLNDPFNFSYEAIHFLKNVVQLRGEEERLEIEEKTSHLFAKLVDYELECMNKRSLSERAEYDEIYKEKEVFSVYLTSKVLSSLNCVNCKKLLNSPVQLPCGHFICQEHPNETFYTLTGSIICLQCGNEHGIPTNGFPPSKAVTLIIDARKSGQHFDIIFSKIEQTLRNYDYWDVCFLKNVTQLIDEEEKSIIEKKMNGLLVKLDDYELKCKRSLGEREYMVKLEAIGTKVEKARNKCRKWLENLNELRVNQEEWELIKRESNKAVESSKCVFANLKSVLLLSRFEHYVDEIEYDFGKFDIDPLVDPNKYINIKFFFH